MAKISVLAFSIFFIHLTFASPSGENKNDRCSSLSCVHASATILDKMNKKIDPCDDFYEYACGTFVKEEYTPDEKPEVNTLLSMKDQLTEFLLTLFTTKGDENEKKLHKLARSFYNSCKSGDLNT